MSALDAAVAETGELPGPDLVVAVQALDDVKLGGLAERILAAQTEPLSTPPPHELWPLINARTSTFTTGGSRRHYARASGAAGLNLMAAMDPDFAGSGAFSSGVFRALLYCHGLAIEDPGALASELFLDTVPEVRPIARRTLEAALTSLVEVHSLLEARVIQTFFTPSANQHDDTALRRRVLEELDNARSGFTIDTVWDAFEATFVDGLQPELAEIWRRVRQGDRHPPLELVEQAAANSDDVTIVETFIDVVAALQPRAIVENAVDVVALTAADIARHGGHHDVLCPSQLYAKLLYTGADKSLDAVRLDELARVDAPRLDELLVEDVVRIRQESEEFASWRYSLSSGLEKARALEAELGPGIDKTAIVAEVMAQARRDLYAKVRRSGVLHERWSGTLAVVTGALGGAVGAATGEWAGLGLGAAGGALPPLLGAILAKTRDLSFLDRHYLLFEPKPEPETPD